MTITPPSTNKPDCPTCESEFDFAIIAEGPFEFTDEVANALFEAGCDDATISFRCGLLYVEFSRKAESLEMAIISAIHDIQKAPVKATVLRVDECNLVTPAEIARRIKHTRQLVHQYITGERGPGNFPAPECWINDKPYWAWCAVSYWLAQNNIVRKEEWLWAEIIWVINNELDRARQRHRNPVLVAEITRQLASELS
jgi:hypothetical protein